METSIDNLCNSLDKLSEKIRTGFGDDQPLTNHWGWNQPALTRHDLAEIPLRLSKTIREAKITTLDSDSKKIIDSVPQKIQVLEQHNLPQFYNGNGAQAIPQFFVFIDWLQSILAPIVGWTVFNEPKSMPSQLARRLKAIQVELDELIPEKAKLEESIQLINEATKAAETLPTDLLSLKEARDKVNLLHTASSGLFSKIETFFNDSQINSKKIFDKKAEADKLVAQCEEAYKITTTKGLAGAFDQRAKKLNFSMWIWVVGLLFALSIAAFIGANRVETLTKSLAEQNPNMSIIWTNLILSIFSIGGPIWFAWIATKQISQRFKLSEDYAFKASVAKAYEGYRREAARIDSAFEARLFSSALRRLEEAPLRVMEKENYGSPWHEFFGSPTFQKALNEMPELKAQFIDTIKNKFAKKEKASEKENSTEANQSS